MLGHAIGELTLGDWPARFAALIVGQVANQMSMEWRFWKAGSLNAEVERRWSARGMPGAMRVAAFLNDARDAGLRKDQAPMLQIISRSPTCAPR